MTSGKCFRGLSTVMAYELMEEPEKITDETLKLSRVMGWCVEMFQTSWLIADDIIDRSETRRRKPCWHKLPNIGMTAVNDSVLIYSCLLHILKTEFGHLPRYMDILELYNETIFYTAMGQHLDYAMSNETPKDSNCFTPARYDEIAKYKTAIYTFNLPVCLGMNLANICDEEMYRKAHEICYKIGRLYQIQDDVIDGFMSTSDTGKTETDIKEGKCSWLAVTALQRCNEVQKEIFTRNYGSPEPGHVEQIKLLYEELEILKLYRQEERLQYDEIISLANNFGFSSRAPELIRKLLSMILNRKTC